MPNLSKQTRKCAFIINLKDFDYEDLAKQGSMLREWLVANAERWAFILHDSDIRDDGGSVNPHFHVVCDLKKRSRLVTTLNRLADHLKIAPLAVQMSEYTSFEACLKYLVHKENPEKFQYPHENIWTNIGKDDLEVMLSSESLTLDFEGLLSICMEENNPLGVMKRIGISYYKNYRSAIVDIFKEKRLMSEAELTDLLSRE